MPTKSGFLLEHFARLAANVAGTSVAVVGVRCRRSDDLPVLAAFGLNRAQSAAVAQIERALASGDEPNFVTDLAADGRFRWPLPDMELRRLRFLGHFRLVSPAGEQVGFVCVLDEKPRAGLTEVQVAALDKIASMIIADRKREQRHLHLMHVANRALRVDKMLRLVSEATTWADGLTSLLEELCRFHGAATGRIWQLVQGDELTREVCRYDENVRSDDAFQPSELVMMPTAAAIEAVSRNEPHTTKFSRYRPAAEHDANVERGLFGQVCIPIWVQQQRFGIVLGFATERADLSSVAADIVSLADTIRPALLRRVTEERIRFVAHHDDLTRLANRPNFYECLDKALVAARCTERGFALLYLDLDGFKRVNDTLGHEMGDKLLVAVAKRLRAVVRDCDTVARMGGDEFAIIQPSDNQPSAAIGLAQRILRTIGEPFELNGRRETIGTSVGIAIASWDRASADILIRDADTALYRAKHAGRNTFQLFEPGMHVHQQEHSLLEQALHEAVDRQQFSLAYQAVCDSGSLRIGGFEALLRWNHATRGLIPPDRFIPLAESSGLIVPLGLWALQTACADAAMWDQPVRLSVNLSPLQLRQPYLPRQIADILSRTGLAAERLDLEVTESVLLDESGLVLRTTQTLREQGISITLDDFGTAYAGLSYLRRFRFDQIKIDQSFIHGLCEDNKTLAIVEAVLSLGDRLGIAVVAEGVETEQELDVLRKLGCRLIQGYITGRPMNGERARSVLCQQRDLQQSLLLRSG